MATAGGAVQEYAVGLLQRFCILKNKVFKQDFQKDELADLLAHFYSEIDSLREQPSSHFCESTIVVIRSGLKNHFRHYNITHAPEFEKVERSFREVCQKAPKRVNRNKKKGRISTSSVTKRARSPRGCRGRGRPKRSSPEYRPGPAEQPFGIEYIERRRGRGRPSRFSLGYGTAADLPPSQAPHYVSHINISPVVGKPVDKPALAQKPAMSGNGGSSSSQPVNRSPVGQISNVFQLFKTYERQLLFANRHIFGSFSLIDVTRSVASQWNECRSLWEN